MTGGSNYYLKLYMAQTLFLSYLAVYPIYINYACGLGELES